MSAERSTQGHSSYPLSPPEGSLPADERPYQHAWRCLTNQAEAKLFLLAPLIYRALVQAEKRAEHRRLEVRREMLLESFGRAAYPDSTGGQVACALPDTEPPFGQPGMLFD